MRIVVLGGTGDLGAAVVARAATTGHDVVAVSRRAPAQLPGGARHVVADVTSGTGLETALKAAEVVIDATNSVRDAKRVLVDGTRGVLGLARDAGVRHFVGVSIVGIDDAPIAYYRVKLAQEHVIEGGGVPWSILRATQFHGLVARYANGRFGIVLAPRGWKLQSIDVREVAAAVLAAVEAGPAGRLPEVAGPEVFEFGGAARAWKRATRRRRLIVQIPVPGATGAFLRSGKMCSPDRAFGTINFASWLAEHHRRDES